MRSIFVLLITLYTSRVLLSVLGVDDFGLYNLVGGVVGLFASLKSLFSFAIQRFLSFAKGQNNLQKERDIFNVSFFLHIIIAIIFALLVEVFGCWFIANKLNIPSDLYVDAYYIFHVSVITAVVSILITPFTAAVIANEKMSSFAWISVIDAILKLFVIILLPYFEYRPVRIYAILLLSVELLNLVLYVNICRKFPECRLSTKVNKNLFKEIASFAGWDFAGNTAWALINEGVNMILNFFGGVAINAARGVSYQVKGAVTQLVNNITIASRPYIVKQAASETSNTTFDSIFIMGRALFLIMTLTTMPIIIYAEQILDLWLVDTPDYSICFVRLVLIWCIIRTINTPIDLAFTAYGKMKVYQIFNSLVLILNIPIAYTFLQLGLSYNYAMLSFIIVEILDITVNLIVAKYQIQFNLIGYVNKVILRNIWNGLTISCIALIFYFFVNFDNLLLLLVSVIAFCVLSVIMTIVTLPRDERQMIMPFILKLINKFLSYVKCSISIP